MSYFLRSSRKVEALCRDFEQQRVCYLPFNMFLLRPLHRLLHYKLILERLCKHYPPTHDDFRDSRGTACCLYAHLATLKFFFALFNPPPVSFQHPWLTSLRWCSSFKAVWWRWRTSRSFWSWKKIWPALITSPSLEGLDFLPWIKNYAKWICLQFYILVTFQHYEFINVDF